MIILRRTPRLRAAPDRVRLAQRDPLVTMIEPGRRRLRLGDDRKGEATQEDRDQQGSDDTRAIDDEDS